MADLGAQDPFETAWRELERAWDNEGAHRKFIAFCAAQAALGEAGRRYRQVRETDPTRAEQAKRGSDAVLTAAMQSMQVTRREPAPSTGARVARWAALFISVLVVVGGLLALLRRASH